MARHSKVTIFEFFTLWDQKPPFTAPTCIIYEKPARINFVKDIFNEGILISRATSAASRPPDLTNDSSSLAPENAHQKLNSKGAEKVKLQRRIERWMHDILVYSIGYLLQSVSIDRERNWPNWVWKIMILPHRAQIFKNKFILIFSWFFLFTYKCFKINSYSSQIHKSSWLLVSDRPSLTQCQS